MVFEILIPVFKFSTYFSIFQPFLNEYWCQAYPQQDTETGLKVTSPPGISLLAIHCYFSEKVFLLLKKKKEQCFYSVFQSFKLKKKNEFHINTYQLYNYPQSLPCVK